MKNFHPVFFLVVSLFFSLLIANHLLPKFCKDCNPGFIFQLLEDANFNSKYVYWGKSYCKYAFCKTTFDKYINRESVTINEEYGNCENILVLGDSFTDSPWNNIGLSYSEHFARKLSEKNHACYILMRVATVGVGNDQELARFTDIVEHLKPSLVVWQFYWNDFYDNVERPLYEFNGDKLERFRSYDSAYFWSGWINQKFPLLLNTNIGNFLLYFGELKKDLSSNWFRIENDPELFIAFNKKKITAFLKEMTYMSEKYNFKYITTLSPLECEFDEKNNCRLLDEQNPPGFIFFSQIQREIEDVLKNNSSYVSMFNNGYYCLANRLTGSDFLDSDPEFGARHLNSSGQQKAGETLFLNFSYLK